MSVADADLVVNATPVGMGGDAGLPCDPSLLSSGQTVVDLVYHPATTPLLEAAAARGARTGNGLPMLVGQAAAAFTLWTGEAAPVAAMAAAVTTAD
jgi:shikimate dehydrogenase